MKLTFREKLIYGIGGIGDAGFYMLVSCYALFFLTTVADVPPALAGSIVAAGGVWDALCCPLIGYLSDNCYSSMGRRRPFMLVGTLPLAAITTLLFAYIDATLSVKVLDDTLMILLFWSAYSSFLVPYITLGSEFTADYVERTVLRSYTAITNNIGTIIGNILPLMLVDLLTARGHGLHSAWIIMVAACSIASAITIAVLIAGSKSKDIPLKPEESKDKPKLSLVNMFRDYRDILRLKPLQLLVAASIFSLIATLMFSSNRLYLFTYNMGLGGTMTSMMMLIGLVISTLFPPINNVLSKRLEKKELFILMSAITAVGLALCRLLDFDAIWEGAVLLVCFGPGVAVYWHIMPSMIYDIREYDTYINGTDRGGSILSVQSLAEALSGAISVQLLGLILQMAGFVGDASVQTEIAMHWIRNCATIVPAFFLLLSCICIAFFPISRQQFDEIKASIS